MRNPDETRVRDLLTRFDLRDILADHDIDEEEALLALYEAGVLDIYHDPTED